MTLNLKASSLSKCLDTVEKTLPSRSTMPAICNILLEIKDNHLHFSSTNLEISTTASMETATQEGGSILIPPKIIEIVRYFPTPEVSLDIDRQTKKIAIRGGAANFELFGADSSDYPVNILKSEGQQALFQMEGSTLRNHLRAVTFAASTEESRPAFNGVLVEFEGNTISLTASDTYRLVIKDISDGTWSFEKGRYLVPARALRELIRLIGEANDTVTFLHDERTVGFRFDFVYFASRLLEEKYPNVRSIIPGSYKTRIVADKKNMENIFYRASLLTEGRNQAVNLLVEGGNLEAKVSSQLGTMEEFLSVEKTGEDLSIHVNTRYVLDILRVARGEKIVLDFHGIDGPLVFRFPDDQGYLYLVLPVKRYN